MQTVIRSKIKQAVSALGIVNACRKMLRKIMHVITPSKLSWYHLRPIFTQKHAQFFFFLIAAADVFPSELGCFSISLFSTLSILYRRTDPASDWSFS